MMTHVCTIFFVYVSFEEWLAYSQTLAKLPEEKFEKMRKAKFDKALKQIEQLSERIQPKGQLQERTSNLLSFCPDGVLSDRIASIYEQLDPDKQEKQWFVVS